MGSGGGFDLLKKTTEIAKVMLLAGIVCLAISCKEDEGKVPNISFNTAAGYLSKDDTMNVTGSDTTRKVGISASKAEDKDVLKKINVTRSANGKDSTMFEKDLSGGEGDNFSMDYKIREKKVGVKAKYTFTISNRE